MDTFKININKIHRANATDKGYDLYNIYTNRGREYLMTVYPSDIGDDVWYFDIPENEERLNDLFVTGEQFPVDYLLKLCKAVITIRYGVVDFDVQLTTEAKKLLKIK
jgi:hypothetical protein